MNPDLVINCLEEYSAEKEPPLFCPSKQNAEKSLPQQLRGAVEDMLMHEGLIEEYDASPNVRVRRTTYRGYLELARLISERESKSAIGKMKRYGWYVVTAVASSAMTILTTWAMKKLGL